MAQNPGPTFPQRTAAFSVHVFTAFGAALALLAMLAAVDRDWALMFTWLALALLVDGIDGPLARALRVSERVPRWSGDVLDLVVDILTYVFVPAYAIATGDVLPPSLALPLASAILVTSVIYFADRQMKTDDNHFFQGFPGVWNVAAFYLFLLRPDPWFSALVVVGLCALSFAPLRFVHPLRAAHWRALNRVLLTVTGVLAALALFDDLQPAAWVTMGLVLIGIYFAAVGLWPRQRGS